MHHVKALGLKFLVIAFTIYTIFEIFANAEWLLLFWISLAVTGISYLIGDMLILRQFSNITATVSDFVLTFFSLFILGGLFLGANVPLITTSVLAAFFITCTEPFIHGYVGDHFSKGSDERIDWDPMNQWQTEFAEETNEDTITTEKDKTD